MSLAESFFQQSSESYQGCLAHPFVQGLASGSLPPECYQYYLAQDATFLGVYLRTLGMGLAKSQDRRTQLAFSALIQATRSEQERELSEGATPATPDLATDAYADFLLARGQGDLGELTAALAPCLSLYAYLAGELGPVEPGHPCRTWFSYYSDPIYLNQVRTLDALLDLHASQEDFPHYRRAHELEEQFFTSAWQRGKK
jgi:thiaminase/transcriptional activator TenA